MNSSVNPVSEVIQDVQDQSVRSGPIGSIISRSNCRRDASANLCGKLQSSTEERTMAQDTPQVLLEHYLKVLRLPSFWREYD